MRFLVVVAALAGCKDTENQPPPTPAEPRPAEPPPVVAKPIGPCENLDLVLVSTIVGDSQHPCHARVDAASGRMMSHGIDFSGTLVSTNPARRAGLFITCQHCTGPDGNGLHDPELAESSTFQLGRATERFVVHRLLSLMPPRTALDRSGNLSNIEPRHDFVIGTVSDTDLVVHDPSSILGTDDAWGNARTGAQVLVMGFPRDLPDHTFAGELVASVGEVLDDARAKDMLSRSDPDEAAIAYDPAVEIVVAARASRGMSGGGAFDERGRYLGVTVRGTVAPVDGTYLVRIVRAQYVFDQLAAALAKAPEPLRAKLAPFVAH